MNIEEAIKKAPLSVGDSLQDYVLRVFRIYKSDTKLSRDFEKSDPNEYRAVYAAWKKEPAWMPAWRIELAEKRARGEDPYKDVN